MRSSPRGPSLPKRVGPLAGILLGLLAAACVGAPRPRIPSGPNVILITIDSLRRDHLSCYGYPKKTTPFLDRIAGEGVRFENAYSTSSWTLPAIVSILSGLDGGVHGAKDGDTDGEGRVIGQPALAEGIVLLPEILRGAGYQTFGVTANEHLRDDLGFARGFDVYSCVGFADAEALRDPLRGIRERIDPARPYFLWVHYLDPHAPYDSNRPELRSFLGRVQEPDGARLRRVQSLHAPNEFLAVAQEPGALDLIRASYDSDIRLVDRAVESLFAAFEIGLDDLVVITADHGEEFMDHGGFGHGHALYEELLQIPLLVRLPEARMAGGTVEARASQTDILPTILDILGVGPPPGLHGRSLVPLIERGRAAEERVVLATTNRDKEIDSLTIDRWKYIEPVEHPEQAMLFDLDGNAGERVNVIDSHPQEAQVLQRALQHLRARPRRRLSPGAPVPVPPERMEALKSLGYVR